MTAASTRDEKFRAEVEAAVMGLQLEVGHLLELVRAWQPDDSAMFKTNDVLDAVRNMLAVMLQGLDPEGERDEAVLNWMEQAARRGCSP